jgi:hypothetical protein
MMTLLTLLILAGGGLWLYRQGKKADQVEELEDALETRGKLHKMGHGHDIKTDNILDELRGVPASPPSVLHKPRKDQ